MNFEVMALIMRKAFGSPTKKQVIQMMAAHINEVSETRVWPSAARLGLRCELHERTVRRTWDALAEDGIIKAVGTKRFRGGDMTVWNVNLKAIMALPDAIPSIEKELEDEEELFSKDDEKPSDILSGSGSEPPDFASAAPGHSVQNPRTQSPTNNPLELSTEESTLTRERIAFDHYNQTATRVGWVTHSKLTDALRKPLSARIEEHGLEKVKAFIDAMAGLEWTFKGFRDKQDFRATLMFITRPRTFAEHFDKLVTSKRAPPPATAATQFEFVGGNAIDRRLVFCFRVYGAGDGWMGARYGWPDIPDRPEAAGLYADELYAEFGVKRPERAA